MLIELTSYHNGIVMVVCLCPSNIKPAALTEFNFKKQGNVNKYILARSSFKVEGSERI